MTEITMYDYILEEKDVLLNILQKRKTITRPFCTLLQEKNVDELVLCGSGTSYHAALAARRIGKSLQIRVRCELPSLFTTQQKIYSKNTLVLEFPKVETVTLPRMPWKKRRRINA